MQAHDLVQAHILECRETRSRTERALEELETGMNDKHRENQAFQRKVLYSVIGLLALTVGKFLADSFHFAVHLGP